MAIFTWLESLQNLGHFSLTLESGYQLDDTIFRWGRRRRKVAKILSAVGLNAYLKIMTRKTTKMVGGLWKGKDEFPNLISDHFPFLQLQLDKFAFI